jgi:hypothetical protein
VEISGLTLAATRKEKSERNEEEGAKFRVHEKDF